MTALTTLDPVERALCVRLVRGSGVLTDGMAAAARRHRVHLVLAASLTEDERATTAGHELVRELRTEAVFAHRREALLRRTMSTLAAAGVDAMLVKGAALAATVYAAPYLRPRIDIDLLVPRAMLDEADRALRADGWTQEAEPGGAVARAQRHFQHGLPGGGVEHLDLHWRIANPPAFARALTWDVMRPHAVSLPAFGPSARGPAVADAIVLACVHLVAHHGRERLPLVWLLDLHLLAAACTEADRARVVSLAAAGAVAGVSRAALERAHQAFDSAPVAALLDMLPRAAAGEPLAHLTRPASEFTIMRADLRALPTWGARVRLLKEHLFPPTSYIRSKYPRVPAPLLPLAALHRIVAGLPGWFRSDR